MSDKDEEKSPKSTFFTYMAEGDQLYHKGEYGKAVESYTTALTLKPGDKNCLVARSKCLVKMGDSSSALRDAEASLKEDKEFSKGLYQKAEALYTLGEFEFALVFFHRGHRLRPELQEFRVGIQKAQEAITNAVGKILTQSNDYGVGPVIGTTGSSLNPVKVPLRYSRARDAKHYSLGTAKKAAHCSFTDGSNTAVTFCTNNSISRPLSVKLENKGDLSLLYKADEGLKEHRHNTAKNEKTAKELLGDLYTHKEFLEKLLKDEDLVKCKMRGGERLQDVIQSCIVYLDTRTEFWRQQKPIYARHRDRKLLQQQWNRARHRPPSDPTRYILKSLEEIDAALSAGNAEGSLKQAREVLKKVQSWSKEVVPNRNEVLGNLYSCIGNALMDLGHMDKALDNHLKDLQLSEQGNLMECKSRALDNIGRVYARIGKFQQAIEAWEEKVPLLQGGLENAWLFHEIGRCHLEIKQYKEARDYGSRSLSAADEICDEKWQLNANVLVAQAELKLGNFKASVLHFERALDWAKQLHDEDARGAIQKALREVRQQVPVRDN